MFSVKLVARPDARMVEVPLEIEAELPREFDGNALLASSGLPRKVKLKAQRDALKLSTAYRADQLLADIVRSTLRGSPQDVQRVQDAVRAYVRTVRERRQEGATLLVQSNGRGKIEVTEQIPQQAAPAQSRTPPPPRSAALQPDALPAKTGPEARVAQLEKRLLELESAIPRIISQGEEQEDRGKYEERLAALEEKVASLQNTVSRAAISAEVAGPGMERRGPPGPPVAREPSLRRGTAVEAFAEGLRDELRVRVKEQLEASARTSAICDRAAALAVEAEQSLGAPKNGTAQRLRTASALAAARQQALRRVQEELDLYQPADLPVAAQLVSRLEEKPGEPEPTGPLHALAGQLVQSALGTDLAARSEWLARAAALCSWTLIQPVPGDHYEPELHDALPGAGGERVASVAAPGLRRHDGSVLSRAKVLVAPPGVAPPPPPEEADEEPPAGPGTPRSASDEPAAGSAEPAALAGRPVDDHAHLLWSEEEPELPGEESRVPEAAAEARPEPAQLELRAMTERTAPEPAPQTPEAQENAQGSPAQGSTGHANGPGAPPAAEESAQGSPGAAAQPAPELIAAQPGPAAQTPAPEAAPAQSAAEVTAQPAPEQAAAPSSHEQVAGTQPARPSAVALPGPGAASIDPQAPFGALVEQDRSAADPQEEVVEYEMDASQADEVHEHAPGPDLPPEGANGHVAAANVLAPAEPAPANGADSKEPRGAATVAAENGPASQGSSPGRDHPEPASTPDAGEGRDRATGQGEEGS